jgi:hypothetical protein
MIRLEKNMHRLVNLRSKALPSYKELSIPTDWMLDSGMALKASSVLYAGGEPVTACRLLMWGFN